MFQLTDAHVEQIKNLIQKSGLSDKRLETELLDHFCCQIESRMDAGIGFELALEEAYELISPEGLKEIETELFCIQQFNQPTTMKKSVFLNGFIAFFLFSTGLMFKVMHWTGASVLMVCAFLAMFLATLLTAYYLFTQSKGKPFAFWLRSISGLLAFMLIAVGFLFNSFHLTGANVMLVSGTVILNVMFIPIFFYHTYKSGFFQSQT